MQVNLGDIPGNLVDIGRPPLPAKALAAAVQLPGLDAAQSPKDATVMEHRVAGDLMMSKMNKSMKKSMARLKSKKKGSHKSDGSARSRKSMANSDLQVLLNFASAAALGLILQCWLPASTKCLHHVLCILFVLLNVAVLFLARQLLSCILCCSTCLQ